MGKLLSNQSDCNSGCSSKYIQGVKLSSVISIQPSEPQNTINIIQNTGEVIINIGDYLDEITAIILNILSTSLVDVNVANSVNIGSGDLFIQSNTISSNTDIIINPTTNVTINGGLEVIGPTILSSDFFVTSARVPIIAYETVPIGTGVTDDKLDRGIAYDWPETVLSSKVKQTGFFGWNYENERFVIWNRANITSLNHYRRTSSSVFGVEIDALFTNIISSENITGSGNTSLLIRSGISGTSSLNIISGAEIHNVSSLRVDSTSDILFNVANNEIHTIGILANVNSGVFRVVDVNNTIDNLINFNPFKISIFHALDIDQKTKTGNIIINSGNNVDVKGRNNILLTSTLGQLTADIATNYLTTTNDGYISFNSKQLALLPPSTLNPTPASGDFDVKAFTKITMQTNGVISMSSVGDSIISKSSTSIFNETLSGGISLISNSAHALSSNPSGAILINAGFSNPLFSTANNLVMNAANEILQTSISNYVAVSQTGSIRIETESSGRTLNLRSMNGSVYLGTDNILPTLSDGAILIKTKNSITPISSSDSINIISDKILRLESETSNVNMSSLTSSISISSATGSSISNITSGDITIRNLSSGNVNVISENGGLIFTSQNIFPPVSSGSFLFSSDSVISTDPGINSALFVLGGSFTINSTSNILMKASTGNLSSISESGYMYLSTEPSTISQLNGSILIATKGSILNSPGLNSISLLSAGSTRIESRSGITLLNTTISNSNILINNKVSNGPVQIISDTSSLYLSTNPSIPILSNGAMLLATSGVTLADPGTQSVLCQSHGTIQLSSRIGMVHVNNSSNSIQLINRGVTNANVNVISENGNLLLSTNPTLPVTLSAGAILLSSKTSTLFNPGLNSIGLSSAGSITHLANTSITQTSTSGFSVTNQISGNLSVINKGGNSNFVSEIGNIYLSTNSIIPTISSGSILISTPNSIIPSTTSNSLYFASENLISIESKGGINLSNTVNGNISLNNSSGNILSISNNGFVTMSTTTSLPIVTSPGSILLATKGSLVANPGVNSVGIYSGSNLILNSTNAITTSSPTLSCLTSSGITIQNLTSGNITLSNAGGHTNIVVKGIPYIFDTNTVGTFSINGTQVLRERLSAISLLSGAQTTNSLRDKLNEVISALKSHGLVG